MIPRSVAVCSFVSSSSKSIDAIAGDSDMPANVVMLHRLTCVTDPDDYGVNGLVKPNPITTLPTKWGQAVFYALIYKSCKQIFNCETVV